MKGKVKDKAIRPRARVKGIVECAVCIQAGNAVSGSAVVAGEIAPDNHLSVRLKGKGLDSVICPRARVKGVVECAVRIQAGNAVSESAVVAGEVSPDEHLPVRLKGGSVNSTICSISKSKPNISGVEGSVQRARCLGFDTERKRYCYDKE